MTPNPNPSSTTRGAADNREDRFATLTFKRDIAAPSSVLWQAWTAPAARAVWAAPRRVQSRTARTSSGTRAARRGRISDLRR